MQFDWARPLWLAGSGGMMRPDVLVDGVIHMLSSSSLVVVVVVRPVKVDDLGTFRFDFLTEAMVSSNNSVAFPDTDTRGCMASFQQAKDNTVADDAASIRNENRAKTRVKVNYKAKATLRDKKWLHGSHRDPADQQQI